MGYLASFSSNGLNCRGPTGRTCQVREAEKCPVDTFFSEKESFVLQEFRLTSEKMVRLKNKAEDTSESFKLHDYFV